MAAPQTLSQTPEPGRLQLHRRPIPPGREEDYVPTPEETARLLARKAELTRQLETLKLNGKDGDP